MKKFYIKELSPRWLIFLAIVDYDTKTVIKVESNLTLLVVTLASKSTTKHASAIRKVLEASTEHST